MRTDYTVIRGDTPTLTLDLVLADATVPDLSGATITFTVDDLFSRSVTDADLSSGEASVTLTVADTEDCPDHRTAYRYDVQVTEADGTVLTPQRGLLIVVPDVDTP